MRRHRRGGNWRALGAAVRDARIRAGHSSGREFARHAGVAQNSVYTLENGEPVAESTIIKVTDSLGWPPGRWRELLESDLGKPQLIIEVPPDEWARLSPEDQQRVIDLVRRLASGRN